MKAPEPPSTQLVASVSPGSRRVFAPSLGDSNIIHAAGTQAAGSARGQRKLSRQNALAVFVLWSVKRAAVICNNGPM
jgi:hypothetical protein